MSKPTKLYDSIRLDIKRLRERQGLSLTAMADIVGVSKQNYHRFESGKAGGMTIRSLENYTKALKVEPTVIFK